MSAYEERKALLELAKVLDEKRVELLHTVNKIFEATTALISRADGLATEAAREKEAGEVTKVSTITVDDEPLLPAKGKRACSLCRQTGHRAKNCPNAHKVREQKMAEVASRPRKRTMKPLTEEQKQKRRDALVKARAARGKKR